MGAHPGESVWLTASPLVVIAFLASLGFALRTWGARHARPRTPAVVTVSGPAASRAAPAAPGRMGTVVAPAPAIASLTSVAALLFTALPLQSANKISASGVIPGADSELTMSGTCLVGFDFTGFTLRNATLAGADLTDAVFDRTDLTGADLTDADLTGARLPR